MEVRLLLVMTLISVHASAQLHGESSTVVTGFSSTEKSQQDTTTVSESQAFSNTTEYQTTEATSNVNTSLTSQGTTVNEASSVSTSKSSVDNTTEESTPVYVEPTTKQSAESSPDATSPANVETTTSKSNEIDSTKLSTESTTYHKAETSTMTLVETQQDITTSSPQQETTKTVNDGTSTTVKAKKIATTTTDIKEQSPGEKSPEEFFKWLDSIEPNNNTESNVTEKEETKSNIDTNAKTIDWKDSLHEHDHHHHHHHGIDPNRMPPKEFFEWLDSIHPDSNTTTNKNIIDTSIISTEKLIIVISTICGTFVLFVAILIAISCCRRKRNLRNDSEKSDFSMNSVISHTEKRNSCNSDIFSPDKNGFNNVFMGIPANNEVWKKLDQLSPTASAVMPESTKM